MEFTRVKKPANRTKIIRFSFYPCSFTFDLPRRKTPKQTVFSPCSRSRNDLESTVNREKWSKWAGYGVENYLINWLIKWWDMLWDRLSAICWSSWIVEKVHAGQFLPVSPYGCRSIIWPWIMNRCAGTLVRINEKKEREKEICISYIAILRAGERVFMLDAQ